MNLSARWHEDPPISEETVKSLASQIKSVNTGSLTNSQESSDDVIVHSYSNELCLSSTFSYSQLFCYVCSGRTETGPYVVTPDLHLQISAN